MRDWTRGKTVALLWFSSALLFFLCFRMALRNSTPPANQRSADPGSNALNSDQRSALYDKMARDLEEKGPVFLRGGETSQSLSLSDIFTLKDGLVTPVLKAANPPVRANVLYLSPEYAEPISHHLQWHAAASIGVMGADNSSLYHFSMFHASHHLEPVAANEREIEAEASAVKAVTQDLCPLNIVLDRVVLTSTGVLLGCWQVISGADPVTVRAKLREALPRAPKKQLAQQKPSDQLPFFHELLARINNQIRGFKVVRPFKSHISCMMLHRVFSSSKEPTSTRTATDHVTWFFVSSCKCLHLPKLFMPKWAG
ncbi:hypothetical protein ACLOJK_013036 [Asimina triloba]